MSLWWAIIYSNEIEYIQVYKNLVFWTVRVAIILIFLKDKYGPQIWNQNFIFETSNL